MKPRSPLDKMIDRACGLPDGWENDPKYNPPQVTLECKKCKKTKRVAKDKTDPEGTARVLMQCPECNPGDFDEPAYFDNNGKEIVWKG
jgi:hypothetical protein